MKRRKKTERKKLIERLDAVFSLWIRKRDKGKCFTCPKQGDIKEMQNGHFVPRNNMSLRFDELNCHCQCPQCNVFKKGAMDEYAANIVMTYGEKTLLDLRRRKHETKKFTLQELKDLIQKYGETR